MSHALIADGVPSDQELLQVGHCLACDATREKVGGFLVDLVVLQVENLQVGELSIGHERRQLHNASRLESIVYR